MQGRVLEGVATDIDAETFRQPVGVCAAITPFNFPAMVPMWFMPFAIGCRQHVHPQAVRADADSRSRSSSRLLADLGLPAGVVNLVHGAHDVVNAILDSPGIDAVSFVGSAPVARYVYERAAATGKRVQALGGAKNYMVVMPDAVIEQDGRQHHRERVRRRRSALHGRFGGRRGRRRLDAAAPELCSSAPRALRVGDGCDPASRSAR